MAYYKHGSTYDCDVTQQGFNESSQKGTPGFFLIVKPVCEVDANTGEHIADCMSYERTVQLWISEKTVDRHIEDLRKLGFDGKAFIDLDPERKGSYSFVNQRIRLVCKVEPGTNGKEYDKFELPFFGTTRVIPNESKVASKLDNLFGKKLRGGATAAPAASKPTPSKAPARQTVPADPNRELQESEDDDSIPF